MKKKKNVLVMRNFEPAKGVSVKPNSLNKVVDCCLSSVRAFSTRGGSDAPIENH